MFHSQDQAVSRRELLRLAAAGVGGLSLSGWLPVLAARAAETGRRHKACILLWMDGGPSHLDTFDPKPDASTNYRGPYQAIATAVPGLQVSEKFPKLAGLMKHLALLRGMSTEEPDHARARVYMHTGYKPGLGGVTYPGLGSIVSAELGRPEFELPNFVVTGTPLNKHDFLTSPGYLGPRHQPLVLRDPSKGLENLQPLVPADDFNDRLGVLEQLEQGFARRYRTGLAEAHQTMLARTVRLMRSEKAVAFDVSKEPEAARAAYGDHAFGRGCLLARRLVEVGVPFVEVYLQNWDSHEGVVAQATRGLMTQVDQGMATLLTDLKERGLLDSTLIVWMGEFGRTPNVRADGGRDHYARAWTTVLAGGGIKGGQAVGKTDASGAAVTERPIPVRDFLATVCRILGIDAGKTRTANGRPVQLVEKGANPLQELFA
jgi:uncharacterized protein (DUF1501 family)